MEDKQYLNISTQLSPPTFWLLFVDPEKLFSKQGLP